SRAAVISYIAARDPRSKWVGTLAAGDLALAEAGRKLSAAKTPEEMTAATALWDLYERQMEASHEALLRVAVKLCRSGKLLSYAREQIGGDLQQLPFEIWEFAEMDWKQMRLTWQGEALYDVKLIDLLAVSQSLAVHLTQDFDALTERMLRS